MSHCTKNQLLHIQIPSWYSNSYVISSEYLSKSNIGFQLHSPLIDIPSVGDVLSYTALEPIGVWTIVMLEESDSSINLFAFSFQ